jgi:uncharacterized membrane protein
MELTVVRLGWTFDFDYSLVFVQVIWAIGWSMVLLSALVFLPRPAILAFGLLLIFGHDAFDGISAVSFGANAGWWKVLHEQGPTIYGHGNTFMVFYPLVPWIGVMPVGYCFGAIFRMPESQRNKWLYGIGLSAIALFIILRGINVYGDPAPWHTQPIWRRTILSFVNCSKYPPSLLYLLMTIGPAITALPLLERIGGAIGRFFTVYGRVPFFYYILHIYLIHAIAALCFWIKKGTAIVTIFVHPGISLARVYMIYITVVLLLYYPCRWFMHVKMNHKKWWLSYL